MKLSELKKIFSKIERALSKFQKEANFQEIEKSLKDQFKVANLRDLPEQLVTAYSNYQQAFLRLQSISEEMAFFIQEHEKAGKQDSDEVNYGGPYDSFENGKVTNKMIEVVKCYEFITRLYSNFKFAHHVAERNEIFKNKMVFDTSTERHLTLLPDEFSDEFMYVIRQPINDLLGAMSGAFNLEMVNQKLLKELDLGRIESNLLHVNFGKDSYASHFDDQSVYISVRTTNTPEQNKKADDFVQHILEQSRFPETIKPNLKALLTTLTDQGVFGFMACTVFTKYFSIHGVKIANFGQGFSIAFRFDEKQQLRIDVIIDQDYYNLLTSEVLHDVTSIIKMDFSIGVEVRDNVPYFMLQDARVACSFVVPNTHPMTLAKSALKDSSRMTRDEIDVFSTCNEHLAKGKVLSVQESTFLEQIESYYSERRWEAVDVAKAIYEFMKLQLNNANVSKVSYIRHWLPLVLEIGDKNVINEVSAFYQQIVSPSGLFSKKPIISDSEHAVFLAKHSFLLQDNKHAYFIKLLSELKLEAKLVFLLEFAKNEGNIEDLSFLNKDFFDKKFINDLNKAIRKGDATVLGHLNNLVTQAPVNTVVYLREAQQEVFFAYDKEIVSQPAHELLVLLQTISDYKFYQRVGIGFLLKLVSKLLNLAYSEKPEDFSMVATISMQISNLLLKDASLLNSEQGLALFTVIDTASQYAKAKLREMFPPNPLEENVATEEVQTHVSEGEKGDVNPQESTSSEEELKLLLVLDSEEKNSALLDQGRSTAEMDVKQLEKEKAISTLAQLREKPPTKTKEQTIEDSLIGIGKLNL